MLRRAKLEGKSFEVVCTETRPVFQGRIPERNARHPLKKQPSDLNGSPAYAKKLQPNVTQTKP